MTTTVWSRATMLDPSTGRHVVLHEHKYTFEENPMNPFQRLLAAGNTLSSLAGDHENDPHMRNAASEWKLARAAIANAKPFEVVKVWGVKPHANGHTFEAYFLNERDAETYAKRGPVSTKGEPIRAWHNPLMAVRVTDVDGQHVYFPLVEFAREPYSFRVSLTVDEAEKNAALAKLTDRERKLLGLSS